MSKLNKLLTFLKIPLIFYEAGNLELKIIKKNIYLCLIKKAKEKRLYVRRKINK